MKNVLVIDSAENCSYDCYQASDNLFSKIFPEDGQDTEFIEDFLARTKEGEFDQEFAEMWRRRVPKKEVNGIDGVLFYGMEYKRKYYPNKRDSDLDGMITQEMLKSL